MRRFVFLLCCTLALGSTAKAAEGRVLKVLPQFLDDKGRASLTPSLYDRDAYQAVLRKNPAKRSGLRFEVQWKAKVSATEPLVLRVEMRGVAAADSAKTAVKELALRQHHWFSHWDYVTLTKDEYQKLGEVTAWRVTLLDGTTILAEQKSFLW
jgi:hypothetical protein